MAGYPHIRYISSGLDGTSFRGPFRGNFEVCNRIKLDICQNVSWGNMGRVYDRASSMFWQKRIIKEIPFTYRVPLPLWSGMKAYWKVGQEKVPWAMQVRWQWPDSTSYSAHQPSVGLSSPRTFWEKAGLSLSNCARILQVRLKLGYANSAVLLYSAGIEMEWRKKPGEHNRYQMQRVNDLVHWKPLQWHLMVLINSLLEKNKLVIVFQLKQLFSFSSKP